MKLIQCRSCKELLPKEEFHGAGNTFCHACEFIIEKEKENASD